MPKYSVITRREGGEGGGALQEEREEEREGAGGGLGRTDLRVHVSRIHVAIIVIVLDVFA